MKHIIKIKRVGLDFSYGSFLNAFMALGIAPSDADKLDRINWFTELIYQAHCLYCIRNRKRAVSKDKFNKFYSKLTVSDLERINNAIKEAEMPDWLVEMQRGKEKNSEVVKKK